MQDRLATALPGPDPYVLVTIPRGLEPSARLALAELYQPFFVEFGETGARLVARQAEWERLAERFPGAVAEGGYRLISLPAPAATSTDAPVPTASPPADVAALVRFLGEHGIPVRALRSFFRDHLLIAEEHIPVYLDLIRRNT